MKFKRHDKFNISKKMIYFILFLFFHNCITKLQKIKMIVNKKKN